MVRHGNTRTSMLLLELPGRRKAERPQRRLMDVEKEDVHKAVVTQRYARDRVRWRQITHCGNA